MPVNSNSRLMKAVKSRSLSIMLGLSFIYAVIFLLLSYWQTSTSIHKELETVRFEVERIFSSEKERLISFYSTRVKCHMASPNATQALEEQDRQRLYQIAKPKYDILTQANPHVTNMQFFAPDGTSLIRLHKPDVFGDAIAQHRPMVQYAVQNQAAVSGFEEGRFGIIYGVIEPVFNQNNEYIGSLEFGFQPEYFEQAIKALFPDVKVALLMPESHFEMSGIPERFEPYRSYYLAGSDAREIKPYLDEILQADSGQRVDIKQRSYLPINHIQLNDFRDKPFMQLLVLKDVEAIDEQFEDAIWQALFMGLLLMLFMRAGASYGLNYFVRNVTRLNRALSDSYAKMDAVFNTSQEGIAILDLKGRFVTVNPACSKQLGYSETEFKKRSVDDLVAIEEIEALRKRLESAQKNPVTHAEQVFFTRSGQAVLLQFSLTLMPNGKHILMATKDITQVKRQQKELERYMQAMDEHVIASKTDMEGCITYASQAFCRISGYAREELVGQKHSIVKHPDMPKSVYRSLWQTIASGQVWRGELKNRAKDGSSYWVEATIGPEFNELGGIVGYTAIRHDISDKKRVEELSITDELTGLYNRRYYNEVFMQELNRRHRYNRPFLFVLMDVDHFKLYNDTYGHQAGDQALAAIADALKASFKRTGDYVFRLGGEEFGAILNVDTQAASEEVLKRIQNSISGLHIEHKENGPYQVISLSIGAYLLTDYSNPVDEDEIYKEADKALYEAKHQGRNRYVVTGVF